METSQLSLPCTCASAQTSCPPPQLLGHPCPHSGFHGCWGQLGPAWTQLPQPSGQWCCLIPARPGDPVGARQEGSISSDGAEQDSEVQAAAAERGRHTDPPDRRPPGGGSIRGGVYTCLHLLNFVRPGWGWGGRRSWPSSPRPLRAREAGAGAWGGRRPSPGSQNRDPLSSGI